MDLMRIQDQKAAAVKAERTRQLMVQVEASNKMSIQIKNQRKDEEQKMEQEIVEYNKKKQQAETENILEIQKVRVEKELELLKLRDKQLKAANQQGEIDELRAKRNFEDGERNYRAKE